MSLQELTQNKHQQHENLHKLILLRSSRGHHSSPLVSSSSLHRHFLEGVVPPPMLGGCCPVLEYIFLNCALKLPVVVLNPEAGQATKTILAIP